MKKKMTMKQALKKVEGSKEDKRHDRTLAKKLIKKSK